TPSCFGTPFPNTWKGRSALAGSGTREPLMPRPVVRVCARSEGILIPFGTGGKPRSVLRARHACDRGAVLPDRRPRRPVAPALHDLRAAREPAAPGRIGARQRG